MHIEAFRQSMRNLAAAGIKLICYNFMPVLNWTRTDLAWRLPSSATCMRFELTDFATFNLHILKRDGAVDDYDVALQEEAARRFAHMTDEQAGVLAGNVVFGLPGAEETLSLDDVRAHLDEYSKVTADMLRQHLIDFLTEVAPLAQELGLRLCCHPDDPPFPLLGGRGSCRPKRITKQSWMRLISRPTASPFALARSG